LLGLKPLYKDPFTKWWPPRVESDYVLIEDMDELFCKNVGLNTLKIWGDEYPFNAEVKGGSALISPALVVVTSNYGW